MPREPRSASYATLPPATRPGRGEHLVFVYGTLRRGGRYHDHYLGESHRVAESVTVPGKMYDSLVGYPILVLPPLNASLGPDAPEEPRHALGEVYRVDEATLRQLDELEGYEGPGADNLYDRVNIPLALGEPPRTAYVLMYTMTEEAVEGLPRVLHGDWLRYEQAETQRA